MHQQQQQNFDVNALVCRRVCVKLMYSTCVAVYSSCSVLYIYGMAAWLSNWQNNVRENATKEMKEAHHSQRGIRCVAVVSLFIAGLLKVCLGYAGSRVKVVKFGAVAAGFVVLAAELVCDFVLTVENPFLGYADAALADIPVEKLVARLNLTAALLAVLTSVLMMVCIPRSVPRDYEHLNGHAVRYSPIPTPNLRHDDADDGDDDVNARNAVVNIGNGDSSGSENGGVNIELVEINAEAGEDDPENDDDQAENADACSGHDDIIAGNADVAENADVVTGNADVIARNAGIIPGNVQAAADPHRDRIDGQAEQSDTQKDGDDEDADKSVKDSKDTESRDILMRERGRKLNETRPTKTDNENGNSGDEQDQPARLAIYRCPARKWRSTPNFLAVPLNNSLSKSVSSLSTGEQGIPLSSSCELEDDVFEDGAYSELKDLLDTSIDSEHIENIVSEIYDQKDPQASSANPEVNVAEEKRRLDHREALFSRPLVVIEEEREGGEKAGLLDCEFTVEDGSVCQQVHKTQTQDPIVSSAAESVWQAVSHSVRRVSNTEVIHDSSDDTSYGDGDRAYSASPVSVGVRPVSSSPIQTALTFTDPIGGGARPKSPRIYLTEEKKETDEDNTHSSRGTPSTGKEKTLASTDEAESKTQRIYTKGDTKETTESNTHSSDEKISASRDKFSAEKGPTEETDASVCTSHVSEEAAQASDATASVTEDKSDETKNSKGKTCDAQTQTYFLVTGKPPRRRKHPSRRPSTSGSERTSSSSVDITTAGVAKTSPGGASVMSSSLTRTSVTEHVTSGSADRTSGTQHIASGNYKGTSAKEHSTSGDADRTSVSEHGTSGGAQGASGGASFGEPNPLEAASFQRVWIDETTCSAYSKKETNIPNIPSQTEDTTSEEGACASLEVSAPINPNDKATDTDDIDDDEIDDGPVVASYLRAPERLDEDHSIIQLPWMWIVLNEAYDPSRPPAPLN